MEVRPMWRAAAIASLPAMLLSSACAGPRADAAPGSPAPAQTVYLPRAHSHNDYERRRPLLDALDRGFASIEVDVVLADGELFVAHGAESVSTDATLTGLYLRPLREVARANGGRIYGPSAPPLQLLVDVKSDANETYEALEGVLAEYSDILTVWRNGVPSRGAVSVVLSGNRAMALIERARVRHVAIDGRILDDRSHVSPAAMPLVSADWETLGPPTEEGRLVAARTVVREMHAEGRRVRFWDTPESEDVWKSLVAIGVDYIGTDEPDRLERLLRRSEGASRAGVD